MMGKMKILAVILSLAILGSAATNANSGEQESRTGCKNAPKIFYKVRLAEVEAQYDHEVYLMITSEDGEPICGFVEFYPPKSKEREYREEWKDRECEENEEKEKREYDDEDDEEWEKEDMEEDDEDEEREEEAKELEREHDEDDGEFDENEEDEEEREGEYGDEDEKDRDFEEEDEEEEREKREDEEEKERGEQYRKNGERRFPKKRGFRFKFEEGKGRFLLFPSSHKTLGTTAVITIRTNSKVKITPFIVVKETDVVIFPDSKDREGHYCEIERSKRGMRFGFEDLKDDPEIDWDYDDVVLYLSRPLGKDFQDKQEMRSKQNGKR